LCQVIPETYACFKLDRCPSCWACSMVSGSTCPSVSGRNMYSTPANVAPTPNTSEGNGFQTIACAQLPVSMHRADSCQRRIQGGPPPPIFGKVNFIFYIVYNVWKSIFEIEFTFYSGQNPSFWKCWGMYACVCESKSWPLLFFVLQRHHFEWYPRPFWSQKYMPDCKKSHLIFQNFLGRPPAGARFGASPPYRAPPFQNCWICRCVWTLTFFLQSVSMFRKHKRRSDAIVACIYHCNDT